MSMLTIDYRRHDGRAVLAWPESIATVRWLLDTVAAISIATNGAVQETGRQVSLPWWQFLQVRGDVVSIWRAHGVKRDVHVAFTERATVLLKQAQHDAASYDSLLSAVELGDQELQDILAIANFKRTLTSHQLRNVRKLARYKVGATFSVPGAGKTTEALAFFASQSTTDQNLLVVAPKNAFAAWDEQIAICFGPGHSFVRLRGGRDSVTELLREKPRFSIITYQQLINVMDLLASHLYQTPSLVFLDESHRIKSGGGATTADAVLGLAHLAVGRLIMSGTPMPQSSADLVPQLQFLFPTLRTSPDKVVNDIQPVYVRTTKSELGLPPVLRVHRDLDMSDEQRKLYGLLKSELLRQHASLTIQQKRDLRAIGKSVMRVLQFCSEPLLLADSLEAEQAELLRSVFQGGDSPKLAYVLEEARRLAECGHKVLIWTSFRRNVEYVAARLADIGAVFIHGGVDAGSEDSDDTREGRVRRFKEDRGTWALVANPAAAGEGISLHECCHHAIYLDRTFNAAHYLQSEDRIHRLGLKPDQDTFVQIVKYRDSIDESVDKSLRRKIDAMSAVLRDPSLRVETISLTGEEADEDSIGFYGLNENDVEQLIEDLSEEP